jgi:transcriptional regulator with XRE-family HTH domain
MANRLKRYMQRQMDDPELKELVEKEIEDLKIGVQIAKLREREDLNQTQLAARAGMNASKISQIENCATNMTVKSLTRVAYALNSRVEVKFVPAKSRKSGTAVAYKKSSLKQFDNSKHVER